MERWNLQPGKQVEKCDPSRPFTQKPNNNSRNRCMLLCIFSTMYTYCIFYMCTVPFTRNRILNRQPIQNLPENPAGPESRVGLLQTL